MKTFHCERCGNLVFFENVQCERCGSPLGYVPEIRDITALDDAGQGLWRSLNPALAGRLLRKCRNYEVENVCNAMVAADDDSPLCAACRLTRRIPDLSEPPNRLYWYRIEVAKRRLLYTLGALRLPVAGKEHDDDDGMAFEFLADTGGRRVLTGHSSGLITLNIAEADDARREQMRASMHEPYRTLLGHLRHEVGHYYFDRLVAGTSWLQPFRELFGDERQDYAASLARHYEAGPPAQWQDRCISAYATSHPWEDWAETWAHYLHMFDTLDTARSCGLALAPSNPDDPAIEAVHGDVELATFDEMIGSWFPLTYVLNSLNRSMGLADGYPFALSPTVLEKLRFVHRVTHTR